MNEKPPKKSKKGWIKLKYKRDMNPQYQEMVKEHDLDEQVEELIEELLEDSYD